MTDTALAIRADSDTGLAMSFGQMRARVLALNEFYQGVMQRDTDYGVIPGTNKPSLFQPGAQLLDGIFGFTPTFEELPSSVRDYERGFFSLDIRCRLVNKNTGEIAAESLGNCNSKEDRYRWRQSKRSCPQCGAEAIIKGKAEYGGGWLCFAKSGGCGEKFRDGDRTIEGQSVGRVENDDTYSLLNTISKMAQKRAHVGATLNATGAGRIFTQDVEDLPPHMLGQPLPQTPASLEPTKVTTPPPIGIGPDGITVAGPAVALWAEIGRIRSEVAEVIPDSVPAPPRREATPSILQAWIDKFGTRWDDSPRNPKNQP